MNKSHYCYSNINYSNIYLNKLISDTVCTRNSDTHSRKRTHIRMHSISLCILYICLYNIDKHCVKNRYTNYR